MNITQRNYTIKRIEQEKSETTAAIVKAASTAIREFNTKAIKDTLDSLWKAIEMRPDAVSAVLRHEITVMINCADTLQVPPVKSDSTSRAENQYSFDLLNVVGDRSLRVTNLKRKCDAYDKEIHEKCDKACKQVEEAAQTARDSVMLSGTALELVAALEQFKITMKKQQEEAFA